MASAARGRYDLPAARQPITFGMFARWYRVNISTHKRGHARECTALDRLTAHFGGLQLNRVSRVAVQEWITARRRAVSAATVNRELDVLCGRSQRRGRGFESHAVHHNHDVHQQPWPLMLG